MAEPPKDVFTIHFHRWGEDYEGWGLYVFGPALNLKKEITWGNSLMPVRRDEFGVVWEVPLKPSASRLSFIIHLGEEKNTPKDVNIVFSASGYEIWILEKDSKIYTSRPPLPSDAPVVVPPPVITPPVPTVVPETIITPPAVTEPPPVQVPVKAPPVSPPTTSNSTAGVKTTELISSVAQALVREKALDDKLLSTEKALIATKSELEAIRTNLASTPSWDLILLLAAILSFVLLVGWVIAVLLALKLKSQRLHMESSSLALVQETETRLMNKSVIDELTGLPNRAALNQALPLAISKAKRYRKQLALLFIDLDHFKPINDTLGHEAGDYVLKNISERFRECLRESDMIARMGGDEFVVLIEDLVDAKFVGGVAHKLLSAAKKGFVFNSQEVHVSASIGIATFPQDGSDPATILRCADSAMYKAKESGKNNFQYSSQELNTHSLQRLALESSLQHALSRKELHLVYQPIISTKDHRILGVEALLRWDHPDMGSISPLQFIPLAEENGIIEDIGHWVLETACRQARKWLGKPLTLSVNVSARQLQRTNYLKELKSVLDKTGFPPPALILDITESIIMINPDHATEVLHGIRDLGVKIALDDFGTGYSSLSNLKKFPIDILKIDRSFLQSVPEDVENTALTSAIIALGEKLNLQVVAEGVENEAQKLFLESQNCPQSQGFLFYTPLEPEEITKLL